MQSGWITIPFSPVVHGDYKLSVNFQCKNPKKITEPTGLYINYAPEATRAR